LLLSALTGRGARGRSRGANRQLVAEWNPTSTLIAALRELSGNPNPFASNGFPAKEPILVMLGRVIAIVAISGPLGVRRYRSMSR